MGKFYGPIGFTENKETAPGVWEDVITEYQYRGDVLRNTRRVEAGDYSNDEIKVDNLISIVANAFANENFFAIRYIKWKGAYWTVSKVDASQRPRLILTIGGVYNGPKAGSA